MKIRVNSDTKHVNKIREELKINKGYCPCALKKTEDTKCMCKNFREQETEGICHCGLYEKYEEEDTFDNTVENQVMAQVYAKRGNVLNTLLQSDTFKKWVERMVTTEYGYSIVFTNGDYELRTGISGEDLLLKRISIDDIINVIIDTFLENSWELVGYGNALEKDKYTFWIKADGSIFNLTGTITAITE